MEPSIEKRKRPRHPVAIQGFFSSGTVRGEEGVVLDLSSEGCRVFSSAPIPHEAKVEIQIRPRQSAPIFIPSAVVRWSSGVIFGLQFTELASYESKTLTHLLWPLTI